MFIVLSLFAIGCAFIPIAILVGPKFMRPPQHVPGFGTRMENCPYGPMVVATLLETFLAEWHLAFGNNSEARRAIDELNIVWIEGHSFFVRGREVFGVTDKPNLVRVCGLPRALHRTGLVHELVHVILWHTTGEPDPDHEHSELHGWTPAHNDLIKRVGRILSGASG